jgi:hypothetical protein
VVFDFEGISGHWVSLAWLFNLGNPLWLPMLRATKDKWGP